MNVFDMPFSKEYACLVQKAERKGRTKDEVDRIITWLTGYPAVEAIGDVTYGTFIDGAPAWNLHAERITGKTAQQVRKLMADMEKDGVILTGKGRGSRYILSSEV